MHPCRQQCRDIDRFHAGWSQAFQQAGHGQAQAIPGAQRAGQAPGLRPGRQPAPAPGCCAGRWKKHGRPAAQASAARLSAQSAGTASSTSCARENQNLRRRLPSVRGLRKVRVSPSVSARSLASGYSRPAENGCHRAPPVKTRPRAPVAPTTAMSRGVFIGQNPREIQKQESVWWAA